MIWPFSSDPLTKLERKRARKYKEAMDMFSEISLTETVDWERRFSILGGPS